MELIKSNLNINFVGKFKPLFTLSLICIGLSLILAFIFGLNYGVDFKGGTEMQFKIDASIQEVRSALAGFEGVEIQEFEGKGNEYTVRMPTISVANKADVEAYIGAVKQLYPGAELIKQHFDSEVGDRIELWFNKPVDREKMPELFAKYNIPATGTIDFNQVGDRYIYKIMLQGFTTQVVDALQKATGKTLDIQRIELVGPKVGKKLREDTILAILYSLIALLIYIALRFSFQSAPGAIFATFHDVMILLGIFVITRMTFDLTVVAAFLTVVGYSLNDTVVVYDRIRENTNNPKKGKTMLEKINTSVNETLSRTIITSSMTFVVVLMLLFFGGEIIRGFSITICLGIIIGTYSSIFIASPVTVLVEKYYKKWFVKGS